MSTKVVTEQEFREGIIECFKALDLDQNNELDLDEVKSFVKAVMKAKDGYDAEDFNVEYEKMDKNADGKISKDELVERVVEVGRSNGLFGEAAPEEEVQAEEEEEEEQQEEEPAVPLEDGTPSRAMFRNGLHCPGKTFNNARHAYLGLNLAFTWEATPLQNIMGIENYRYLQYVDVSGNKLTTLSPLSAIKHLIRLNARNNQIARMLDFDPPANLEEVDYSQNLITRIENCDKNPYLKHIFMDQNQVSKIEGLETNNSLRVLSMSDNNITVIENLDGLWLQELNLSKNQLTKITGLDNLRVLQSLDLSRNQIRLMSGLENIESLRFLNLSLNAIEKVNQFKYIELLPLLTELDLCFNPIMNKKHYRLQALFHIPQLRMLDGQEIICEEKVKAENLHGGDSQDRETIFKSLLPQEDFVDRRINIIEDVGAESDEETQVTIDRGSPKVSSINTSARDSVARSYVGELINRVEVATDGSGPNFVMQ